MEYWTGTSEKKPLWERNDTFRNACIAYMVAMLLFVLLRVVSGFGVFGDLADAICGNSSCLHQECIGALMVDIVASVLIQIFIFFLVPLFIFRFLSKEPTDKILPAIGFNRPSGRTVGYSFLLGVLVYVFNIFIASLAAFVLIFFGFRSSGGGSTFIGPVGLLIGIVIVGVLPGVCEEVSNRGILLRGLMPKLGVWRAVLVSSLIFGLMHLNITQAIYAAILGVLIALAILATRSLWTGIIIHFMNNALSVISVYASSYGIDFINIFIGFFGGLGGIVFFILPVVSYILIIRIIHMFARENFKKNEKEYFGDFLKKNPAYITEKMSRGQVVSIDEMSASVDAHASRLGKMKAIQFYLEPQRKTQKLNPIEKTLLFGIIFLTSVVTLMTLVWGLPPFF